jgi:hypothetical protein
MCLSLIHDLLKSGLFANSNLAFLLIVKYFRTVTTEFVLPLMSDEVLNSMVSIFSKMNVGSDVENFASPIAGRNGDEPM